MMIIIFYMPPEKYECIERFFQQFSQRKPYSRDDPKLEMKISRDKNLWEIEMDLSKNYTFHGKPATHYYTALLRVLRSGDYLLIEGNKNECLKLFALISKNCPGALYRVSIPLENLSLIDESNVFVMKVENIPHRYIKKMQLEGLSLQLWNNPLATAGEVKKYKLFWPSKNLWLTIHSDGIISIRNLYQKNNLKIFRSDIPSLLEKLNPLPVPKKLTLPLDTFSQKTSS